jgi:hypothetical protein
MTLMAFFIRDGVAMSLMILDFLALALKAAAHAVGLTTHSKRALF